MIDIAPILPWDPGLATGRVVHQRHTPTDHRFAADITQLWIDPDRPQDLTDRSRWWSSHRPAPGRFRRADYLDGGPGPIGVEVRRMLTPAVGHPPSGPLRVLTQPRVWGWVFNPLTVYLAWDNPNTDPSAMLLEVTNTPWKERHHYPVALTAEPDGLHARFAKSLHVSPFLDNDHTYRLHLQRPPAGDAIIDLSIDVFRAGRENGDDDPTEAHPVLSTQLVTHVNQTTGPAELHAVLRPNRLPTHRVSLGIHRQALALLRKRVPFVPHPRKQP